MFKKFTEEDVRAAYERCTVVTRVEDPDKALGSGCGEKGEKTNAIHEIFGMLDGVTMKLIHADGGIHRFDLYFTLEKRFCVWVYEFDYMREAPFNGVQEMVTWLNKMIKMVKAEMLLTLEDE